MPSWRQIVWIFLTLAWSSADIPNLPPNRIRKWYPEQDVTIFKKPTVMYEIEFEYASTLSQRGNLWAFNTVGGEARAAFIVGPPNIQPPYMNNLLDPVIEFGIKINPAVTYYADNGLYSFIMTFLLPIGEYDVMFTFFKSPYSDALLHKETNVVFNPDDVHFVKVYSDGKIVMHDKEYAYFDSHKLNKGYPHCTLYPTNDQLIPFILSSKSISGFTIFISNDRLALLYPDEFTPQQRNETSNKDYIDESDVSEEVEQTTTTEAPKTSKAGFSDWYYIIIIVAIFLVFMVALFVVLIIKKRKKDKRLREENEARRAPPSVSSQQPPSVDQEQQGN